MKIITKQEFYGLPEGILYSKLNPNVFESLFIKGETLYDDNLPLDFYDLELIGNVQCNGSDDLYELLHIAVEEDLQKPLHEKISLSIDFEAQCRDGLYEDDMLFAVYEENDITEFIKTLEQSLIITKNLALEISRFCSRVF